MTSRARHPIALILGTLALLLPLGCVNPFKPADPETPTGEGVVERFRTTEELLETLELALENKTANGVNAYSHCFSDSAAPSDVAFRAIYDPAVKLVWQAGSPQEAPEPWNLLLEKELPGYLFNIRQNAAFNWEFTPDPTSGNDEEGVLLHRTYRLIATEPNSSNPDTIAIGYCDLNVISKDSKWSIARWTDRLNPNVGSNPSNGQYTMTWWRLNSRTR